MTGRDIRLKWPNDLLLEDCKLAGLLVEARPSVPSCVIVGCGINVRVPASFFAARGLQAASLLAEGAPGPAREEILAEVLRGMESGLEAWRDGRDPAILEAWSALDALQGREVEAHLPQGVERGRALGLNEAGLLRLRLHSGEVRCLSAAEVHLR
jgi:BirA family biotin operon repressor/biotin-[acetyl-CoA-carboxylase] ligase